MKKNLVKLVSALSAVTLILSALMLTPYQAHAAVGYDNSRLSGSGYILRESRALPSYYSSKDLGYVGGVDNQLSTSVCWAFTQNEVIETFLAKTAGKRYDLSEQTMKFETSYATSSRLGYDRMPNDGGNEYMSVACLAAGGATLEADEPFSVSESRRVSPGLIKSFGYLKSAPMFEYQTGYNAQAVALIKQLVYEYGAVGTGLYYNKNSEYENADKTNYYYNGDINNANHSVTVIGWDDNYSADNFSIRPQGDGAFIIKNSWGNYHDNYTSDCVYVSYYDKFAGYQFFTSEYYAENDLYDNIYQYDLLGYLGDGVLHNTDSVVCVTKFDAKSAAEAVNAVSTYIIYPGVTVEVLIDPNGGDADDAADYIPVCKQTFDYTGYHMLTFDGVRVTGSGFNVAVRYTMPKGYSDVRFPLQTKRSGYSSLAQNTPDTCYFGSDFKNLYKLENKFAKSSQPMLCIKAFTKNVDSTFAATLIDTSEKFNDVPADAWYKKYVDYAVTYRMFKGTDDAVFSPLSDITRAQFVQVLANLSGAVTNNSVSSGFSDVASGEWYTGAVKWAVVNGVAKGMGNGKFEPDAKIDRQQMCVMLVNYTENYSKTKIPQLSSAGTFTDDTLIASWAKTAVYKCRNAGIVSGTGNGKFSPAFTATRCEAATVLSNFHKIYN